MFVFPLLEASRIIVILIIKKMWKEGSSNNEQEFPFLSDLSEISCKQSIDIYFLVDCVPQERQLSLPVKDLLGSRGKLIKLS